MEVALKQKTPAELSRLEILQIALKTEEENIALKAQVIEDKPKVDFHNAVAKADKGQSFDEIARVLGIGRNKLYKKLRAEMVLMKGNLARQKYIDQGYFVSVEQVFDLGESGEKGAGTKTLVTGKGLQWIQKKFFGGQVVVG